MVFEDLWHKAQTVLQLSNIPLILLTLRELAEGKEVILNDGQTTIQPLQRLGIQTSYPDQQYYIRAVESLLTWFVRELQFHEAHYRGNLLPLEHTGQTRRAKRLQSTVCPFMQANLE